MDTFTLANQVEIPVIGFGTYKTTDGSDCAVVRQAIEARILKARLKSLEQSIWICT